jgi:hypothetical protein
VNFSLEQSLSATSTIVNLGCWQEVPRAATESVTVREKHILALRLKLSENNRVTPMDCLIFRSEVLQTVARRNNFSWTEVVYSSPFLFLFQAHRLFNRPC